MRWESLRELKKHVSTNDFNDFTEEHPHVKRVVVSDDDNLSETFNNSYTMIDNDVTIWW